MKHDRDRRTTWVRRDGCIFMLLGKVVEYSGVENLFLNPANPKTAEYIEGRYGRLGTTELDELRQSR